jgi:histidinol-phosphate/aromatic aminotransferase/cobyric acid decarboxylase-like protein/choline kinase
MQFLILAAGMGRRLKRYTRDNTKCMVEVNGKKIITYLLENIEHIHSNFKPVNRIVIGIGYEGRKLKDFVGTEYHGIPILYVENPDYDKTNNIYSLWLTREYFREEDTVLLESDLIFEDKILERLVSDPYPNLAVVARYENWMDGTVTLLDEDDNILNFISKSEFSYGSAREYFKTVNIYKFSKDFINTFYLPFLEAYSKAYGNNEYYEQVLKVLIFIRDSGLKALRLGGERWYEIDDAQDLDIASCLFQKKEKRLQSFQERYGGYWRFPQVLDYCYLVNPYFPPPRYLEEYKYNLETLLKEYPSGQRIHKILAGNFWGVNENYLLVGNGAAELIKALTQHLPGSVGCVYPTFNEYPERIPEDRLVRFFSDPSRDYRYALEDLKEWIDQVDSLILINPDNPTGNFISQDGVEELLEYAGKEGKTLVVDESFVDFAAAERRFTLLYDDSLEKYPHLVVMKSISKSFGVAGLRLGILASSNSELLEKIFPELSIWNINSFAEYFLQSIVRYKKDYFEACNKIRRERERFSDLLAQIPGLKVFPSEANYLLCELTGSRTSSELAELLLEIHGIFIKDLKGKTGFDESKQYIRLAIRTEAENDLLTAALEGLT